MFFRNSLNLDCSFATHLPRWALGCWESREETWSRLPTSCFGYNVLVRRQSSCCHRRAGRASGELCVTTILSLPEQKLKGCLRRGINASPEGLVPPGVHSQETSPQDPSALCRRWTHQAGLTEMSGLGWVLMDEGWNMWRVTAEGTVLSEVRPTGAPWEMPWQPLNGKEKAAC